MPAPRSRQHIRLKWYIVFAGIIFIGLLIYSTLRQSVYRYEVCMDFHGRHHCAQASGPSRSAAIRSAQEIDCELLANGREENIACLGQQPSSAQPVTSK